jgi:peptide/nickel transport system substrate-binding protein/oligopeptide transport system substrate-binding protein
LIIAASIGCSGAPAAPPPRAATPAPATPRRGGTLTVDLAQDVGTLDPANLTGKSLEVGHLLFDTLATLADKPAISPDALTYRFKLRAAAYADGTPIRADDFVYAIERLRDPKIGAAGASLVDGVREARVRGEQELEIVLDKPDASFPMHFVMPQTAPIPRGYAEARLRTDPPISGPFRIAEWREGQTLMLARNVHHAGPVWLDAIVIRLGVPLDVAALRFFRGETDLLLDADGPTYRRLFRSAQWKPFLRRTPSLDSMGIAINTRRPPLDDVRVRQALNLAINSADLALLSHGALKPSTGPVPPGIVGFDPEQQPWPRDVARARALLAQAGHPELHLRYTVLADQANLRLAQSIQADLAEAGVTVDIEPISEIALPAVWGRGDFDLIYDSWGADFPDASNFFVAFHSRWIHPTAALNHSRYSNPAVDRLIDDAAAEADPARRAAMLREIGRRIHDECPWIWLTVPLYTLARQPDVGVGDFDPLWQFDLRAVWK